MVAGQVTLRAAGIVGVPVFNVENACASASTALHLACEAVRSGRCDIALAVGAEKMSHPDKGRALTALGGALDVEDTGASNTDPLSGAATSSRSSFMDIYARIGRDYMAATGATAEDLAAVAVKNQSNGQFNPRAQYGAALTVEQVLSARMIVDPLTLPMCSPISDGAAAAVVVSPRVAGFPESRVDVLASVVQSGQAVASAEAVTAAARAARAGLRAGRDRAGGPRPGRTARRSRFRGDAALRAARVGGPR